MISDDGKKEAAVEDGRPGLRKPRSLSLGGGLSVPYPEPSSRRAKLFALSNRRADTGPERRLRSELHRRGLRYRKDHALTVEGMRIRPDVVFAAARVAVFVDGCFWHGCPEHGRRPVSNSEYWGPKLDRNVQRDQQATDALVTAGWRVVRVWEHESVDSAADRIASLVSQQRGS